MTSILDAARRPRIEDHSRDDGPRTSLPRRDGDGHAVGAPRTENVRNTDTVRVKDVATLIAAALSAIAIAVFLYFQSLPLEGAIGFLVLSFILFVAVYLVMISLSEPGTVMQDRFASIVIHAAAILLVFALAVVVVFTFVRGSEALPNPNFYVQDMSLAGPQSPLSDGGVLHAIVGTLIQIGIALAISIPLGVTAALFLSEIPGPYSRFVRTVVEAMTALPSIVAGLFIYATVVVFLGFDRSGFAASLAITVMMLPIIIRSADVVLRLVPGNLKEASLALGSGQWRTAWNVTLPTARSGLTTAVILGTARGIGETSPVLLTAGFTQFLNVNPFTGPMVSLPLATFNFVRSPEPTMIARGFGTAAVLMVLVLILFVIARVIGGRGPGQLTNRQRRAAVARSRRDAARFAELDAAAPAATPPAADRIAVPPVVERGAKRRDETLPTTDPEELQP